MSDNYTNIMLEEIREQNKAILEVVDDMQRQLKDVPKRNEFEEVKADMKIVKAAVTDTSHEVHELDRHVARLEARA